MKLLDYIKAALASAENFAKANVLPWLKNFLLEVEHDAVTNAMPYVETAGAAVAATIISGQPAGAIGATVAAIALQLGRDLEKEAVQITAHDFSAAITGYLATLKATGAKATDAQPQ
jgi:hypothetical protein